MTILTSIVVTVLLVANSQSDPVVGPPDAPIEEQSRFEVTDRAVETCTNNGGKKCKWSFWYSGRYWKQCTTAGDDRPWCYHGDYWGSWHYCDSCNNDCPWHCKKCPSESSGTCKQWCSTHNFCGSTNSHMDKGTD